MDSGEVNKRKIDWVGGRKFALVVGVLILGTVLLVGDLISVEAFKEWANSVWLTITSYLGGNVANKFATKPSGTNRASLRD